jgi:hypothetical protein
MNEYFEKQTALTDGRFMYAIEVNKGTEDARDIQIELRPITTEEISQLKNMEFIRYIGDRLPFFRETTNKKENSNV